MKYAEDKVDAVKEMVNLVLKSTGCYLQVTNDDIEDPDNAGGRLGDLQEEFQAVSNVVVWSSSDTNFSTAAKHCRLPAHLESQERS